MLNSSLADYSFPSVLGEIIIGFDKFCVITSYLYHIVSYTNHILMISIISIIS